MLYVSNKLKRQGMDVDTKRQKKPPAKLQVDTQNKHEKPEVANQQMISLFPLVSQAERHLKVKPESTAAH